MIDISYLLGICAILAGGLLWLVKPIFQIQDETKNKGLCIVLACLSLFSLFFYTRYGKFHLLPKHKSQNFHMAEIFHYYLGSKYFKETGHFDLYNCTFIALNEIEKTPLTKSPQLFAIRDLRNKVKAIPQAEVIAKYAAPCHSRFSENRWISFKKDIEFLTGISGENSWWRSMLFDAGYNSSPAFPLIAGSIANAIPLERGWKLLGYFDMVLVGIAVFAIYQAFGLYPVFAFLLIFGTNPLASYLWTGGSFFRHAWFFALTLALCFGKKGSFFLSGIFWGYATTERIFPGLFFFGACIPLIYQSLLSKRIEKNLRDLSLGFVSSFGALFLLSVLAYGLGSWKDFFVNMSSHNRYFWVPHVGLKKNMVYFHGIENRNFWYEQGLANFIAWNKNLYLLLKKRAFVYYGIVISSVLSAVYLSRKRSPEFAALLVGGTLFYTLALPAAYYYVYLALFPAVFYKFPSTICNNIRLILCFLLVFILTVLPMLPPDDIIKFMLFSFALGAFFMLEIITAWAEERSPVA